MVSAITLIKENNVPKQGKGHTTSAVRKWCIYIIFWKIFNREARDV